MIWVEKYRPTSSSECVGQNKNIIRIKSWLKTYDPSKSRPLFIYGPPGIGKTTAAHLCCKELKFNVVEFNASDQRNKNIIKEVISTAFTNTRINLFGRASDSKDAIILDEIDGMAGNEDRGGIAQILIEIRKTLKPIIFICNDGQHQKLRTLKDKCEVIEFRKPELDSIRAVVSKIAREEKLNIDKIDVRNLAESSEYDIRQIVNSLSLFKDGSSSQISKTTRLNPFEATKKALTASSKLTMEERFDCFFADYNIMPLFMFENYAKNRPVRGDHLKVVSQAIDSLCLSDLADKEIRSHQNWSLLNVQGLLSTVIPSNLAASSTIGRIDFPQFLGKLSNANKRLKLTQELNAHMCLSLRGGLDPDYLEVMRERLSTPLIKHGVGGIDSVIDFMHDYSLLRDDFNSIMELASWSFKPDPMARVDSKTKTAFTLAYKKRSIAMPYFTEDGKAPKKRSKVNLFSDGLDEDEEEDEEDEIDAPIKPKKVSKAAAAKQPKEKPAKAEKEKPVKAAKAVVKEDKQKPVDDEKQKPAAKVARKQNGKMENGNGKTNGTQSSQATTSSGGSYESEVKEKVEKPQPSKPDKRPPADGGIQRFFISNKKQKSS